MTTRSTLAIVGTLLTATLTGAGCGGDDESEEPEALTPEELVQQASPGTVELVGKKFDKLSGGSGFVYDAERNLVLTNAHVVDGISGLQAKVGDQVPLLSAQIVGSAPCDDVAVVELQDPPPEVTELPLGDSESVAQTNPVTALGYPDNFQRYKQQTVTSTQGTVSNADLVGNSISDDLPTYPALIQHTAAVNPGNSGGPLLNDQGEVVGINTLSAAAKGSQGQYYSIDINQAKELLPELEAGNSPADIGLAMTPVSLLGEAFIADDLNLTFNNLDQGSVDSFARDIVKDGGMWVLDAEAGTPAEDSGIVYGDVVTRLGGSSVETTKDVCRVLESAAPGETLEVEGFYVTSGSFSQNGEEWTSEIKMAKDTPPAPATEPTTSTTTTATE